MHQRYTAVRSIKLFQSMLLSSQSTLVDDSRLRANIPEVSHETSRSGKDLDNLSGVSCYDDGNNWVIKVQLIV